MFGLSRIYINKDIFKAINKLSATAERMTLCITPVMQRIECEIKPIVKHMRQNILHQVNPLMRSLALQRSQIQKLIKANDNHLKVMHKICLPYPSIALSPIVDFMSKYQSVMHKVMCQVMCPLISALSTYSQLDFLYEEKERTISPVINDIAILDESNLNNLVVVKNGNCISDFYYYFAAFCCEKLGLIVVSFAVLFVLCSFLDITSNEIMHHLFLEAIRKVFVDYYLSKPNK